MNNIKELHNLKIDANTSYLSIFNRVGRTVNFGFSESAGSRTTAAEALKVNVDARGNPFAGKYNKFRNAQYGSEAPYYVNLSKVLYDPEINFEVENGADSGVVSDDCWKSMLENEKQFDKQISKLKSELTPLWAKHCIAKYLGIIYKVDEIEAEQKAINKKINALVTRKKQWSDFSKWMVKLLSSSDGLNNVAFIKMRVFNLYQQIMHVSGKDQNRLLDLVSEYSTACEDRAVVGLEKAEVIAQFIAAGEDLKLNVLILEFKRHLIQTELVPAVSRESVETYLFYSLYFNELLGLRNQNKSMNSPFIAVKRSFDVSVEAIFKRMTVEDLIGFISSHELFQEAYHDEYMAIVDELQGAIADLDYDDPRILELNNVYQKVTNFFYQEKAQKLLVEKGFITVDVDYEAPDMCPGANIIEPKQLSSRLIEDSSRLIGYMSLVFFEKLKILMSLVVSEEFINRNDVYLFYATQLLFFLVLLLVIEMSLTPFKPLDYEYNIFCQIVFMFIRFCILTATVISPARSSFSLYH